MSSLNIFLDDGGVITDKQRRAAEFERLVGDCFVPLLGGTEAAWTRAHRAVVDRLADPLSMSLLTAADFVGFYRGIQAALPGAVEAIRLLHRQGYALHTASGSCSLELAGSLEGLGVRQCFGRLYGADLVNTFKAGPAYYARLFADAGVQPEGALVVDDSAEALDWAAHLGARTVLVSASPHPEPGTPPRLTSLAELPACLRRWA